MAHRLSMLVAIVAMLGGSMPRVWAGSNQEQQVTWDGLSAVVGREVRVVMPDGARIEGKAAGLEVDGLEIDIRKTSNKKAYPKGRFLAPRATLHAVDVVESPTKYWRIAGVAVGGGLGYLAARGAVNLAKSSFSGGAAGLGALAAALPVAGYSLGRAADRRATTYVIKP